ncbi:hypothetical protein [Enhygromyxa salina]|nr:hypothetical protein [Enhygromyxa salina]
MHRLSISLLLLVTACNAAASEHSPAEVEPGEDQVVPATRVAANASAYIPSQCYADTIDADGGVHNPCFACHHDGWRPNFVADGSVQLAYDLPDPALTNPWTNLRVDRSAAIAATDTAELLRYVRDSNYREGDALLLADRLATPPSAWDPNGDGVWSGYTPDAWFEFDQRGFDRSPDGTATGWRAYAFRPMPGAFFPTNGGSLGDALIRLPPVFRRNARGTESLEVYELNLAILEALITRADVVIDPTSERPLGVDLDGDGSLGTATRIRFQWAPLRGQTMRWVGAAGVAQDQGEIGLAAGLFPVGTELLHSVRYLDVTQTEQVVMAPRMKELRYARKRSALSYSELDEAAAEDAKQRIDFPDRVRDVIGQLERGVDNGIGWVYQGFIEDAGGQLRPQTVEETMFCVGCHSGVGATDDGIYSFGRKLGAQAPGRGWIHAAADHGYRVGDHTRADGLGEYATYLIHNGAGDDFRANQELLARFFDERGEPQREIIDALAQDVTPLLIPSPARALALDAAYRLVVQEQSFVLGRDAVLAPTPNLHTELAPAQPTGIEQPEPGPRDRRSRAVSPAL